MGLTDILQLMEKYGIKGTIVAILVALIYYLSKAKWVSNLFSKIFDKWVEHIIKSKSKTGQNLNITETDILNHDIFNYIDFWTYSKVPTLHFSTEYRTAVFRKYLVVYLRKHKEVISKYINSKAYETMNDTELWSSLLSLINDIIYSYEREMETVGIPKIVIDKMKVKNNDIISLTVDIIEGICNNHFYHSEKNLLKIYSILNILLSILESTISNSESVCNSINGALHGMTFEGKTEP